ncbi:hypothetical protein Tco_0267090 [Tanacetum coccineum]
MIVPTGGPRYLTIPIHHNSRISQLDLNIRRLLLIWASLVGSRQANGRYGVSVLALHKKPRRTKSNTLYPEDFYTPYPRYSKKIFGKILNVVPTPRNFQYAVVLITEFLMREYTLVMTELILRECMEKAQAKSSLAKPKTDNDVKIKLSEEFLMELRSNAYCGTDDEDVVDHIAKVLEILDLIKTPNVDTYCLRMKVFPLSLAGDARQWWINEGDGKITT